MLMGSTVEVVKQISSWFLSDNTNHILYEAQVSLYE